MISPHTHITQIHMSSRASTRTYIVFEKLFGIAFVISLMAYPAEVSLQARVNNLERLGDVC